MPRRRRRSTYGTAQGSYGGLPGGQAVPISAPVGNQGTVGNPTYGLPAPGQPGGPPGPGAAAPGVGPAPKDWQQVLSEAQQAQTVNYANAQAQYDTSRINRDFGYLQGGGIDPNNPYSRANLLEQSYRNSTRGTGNQYGAQGQIWSGAYKTAQNENFRQYNQGSSQLRNEYQDALGQVALQQLGTYAGVGASQGSENLMNILRQLGYLK